MADNKVKSSMIQRNNGATSSTGKKLTSHYLELPTGKANMKFYETMDYASPGQ